MKISYVGKSKRTRELTSCALIVLALGLGGCAGMMKKIGEELSDEKIDFEPVYTAKLDARSGRATIAKQSPQELEKADYINIGSLTVKYIDKRCFPGEECETESHSGLPTERLLGEASSNGGDLVKISRDNHRGQGQAVKNGACLRTQQVSVPRNVCDYETTCGAYGCSTRQTICRTEYSYQTQCVEWQKIYGDEYYTLSQATVWRKDPELIAQVRFGDEFFKAIETGQVAQVKALAAKGIRVDVQDLRGRYPLEKAAEANHTPVVSYLLEQGARPDVDNSRALVIASEKNNAQSVKLMLEHGADPNAKIGFWKVLTENAKPEEGKPLINAASKENLDMVRALLQHKADPNAANGDPLKIAVGKNNREMISVLLDHGASVREDGVLTAVVYKNDMELLKLFLDKGADPDNRDWKGLTPLQAAAGAGYIQVMRVLIDKGADIDKRGVMGAKTPLMHAVENGQVEAVRLLLEHKADVTVTDIPTGVGWMAGLMGMKGKTALSVARSKVGYTTDVKRKQAYQEIVSMLEGAGAKE